MPRRPTISAPVGKSGPLIRSMSASSSSSLEASGFCRNHWTPSLTSRRLWRRDVGGHADRDAGRAVHQQVGEARGQHDRLGGAAVVVGAEVDGVLVDVPHHLHGQRRHLALGVPHGRGRVVARGAEVAVAVDQQHPQRPGLGQAHQGVVDRGVAVRVVDTHDLADDAGALVVAAARAGSRRRTSRTARGGAPASGRRGRPAARGRRSRSSRSRGRSAASPSARSTGLDPVALRRLVHSLRAQISILRCQGEVGALVRSLGSWTRCADLRCPGT